MNDTGFSSANDNEIPEPYIRTQPFKDKTIILEWLVNRLNIRKADRAGPLFYALREEKLLRCDCVNCDCVDEQSCEACEAGCGICTAGLVEVYEILSTNRDVFAEKHGIFFLARKAIT